MYIQNVIFQMHYSQTICKEPPFSFEIKVKNTILKRRIPKSEDEIRLFNDLCYEKYKKLNNPIGTVDVNPITWTQIVLSYIEYYIDERNTIISFPNGCCNRNICNINCYYKIITNELLEIEEEEEEE
jgi:hypothetical protein